ncbi:hypothetical protein N8Z42_03435 [Pelagibacteraceae bacterium]|nr:hypothetical protein [Pelagibacteraceae bacterium]
MFKYIKKLTSVVVMFAVIIVFSTSKVYAASAFSMPPNVEKLAQVVGIVSIATLTGIGLKSKQDVDKDKAEKLKVLNIITMIGVNHFFSQTDSKKLDTIMIAAMVGSIKILNDIKKTSELKKNKPYTDANKISPINLLNIDYTAGGLYNDKTKSSSTNNLVGTISTNELTPLFTLEIKIPKSNTLSSGRYYEGVQEADGSWTLSDAGLKRFLTDDAIINQEGDGESDGGHG